MILADGNLLGLLPRDGSVSPPTKHDYGEKLTIFRDTVGLGRERDMYT